jgi:aldehyde dehydrogenase (NAD+)
MSTETMIQQFPLFINGEWTPVSSGETFDVINPATGEVAAKVAKASKKEVDMAVESARNTFESGVWSNKKPEERAQVLMAFSQKIIEHAQEIIYIEAISSGGTIRKLAGADIMQLVLCLQQTAKQSLDYRYVETLPIVTALGPSRNQIVREPIGVVAAITPWNFPLVLAMWKIAPALMMGNSIVVKPASYTPLGTLKLAELAVQAGLPPGVFNVITGPGSTVGEALVTHREVDKVAFTGSTEVGRIIMKQASETVKKVTLELGGKAPAIVLPDADLELTIPGILFGVFFHSGQVCESGTRLLVHDSIYEEVIQKLAEMSKKIKVGPPMDFETGMGPVVSRQQMETVLSYIQSGIDEGARLVCGGKRATGPGLDQGYYIEPTIFADVRNEMKIAQEEIFGPVLSIIRYSTEEEAIKIANDTIYGLSAGFWTRDVVKANKLAGKIKAGTIWINDWHMFRMDAPFGGYKQSGVGRELGKNVLDEYTEVKHVHTALATENDQRAALKLIF